MNLMNCRTGLMILLANLILIPNLSAQEKPPQVDKLTRDKVLAQIQQVFVLNYVYPDKGRSVGEFLKQQQQENKYDAISEAPAFANSLTRDIRKLVNDRHIRIEYNPRLEKDILKFNASPQKATEVRKEEEEKDRKLNFFFSKLEILPSNIGYIEFTNFAVPREASRKTVQAAMQFVSNAEALIIDLRNNRGGNVDMANELLSYFFESRTFTGKSYNRITNQWKENFVEIKPAITRGLKLKMPLYILTSSRTFSAAEGFAYTLQGFGKAIIIGDTTSGSAHLTRSFSLGNGFVGFIPYLRSENVRTGGDWEGKGVIPDKTTDESKALMIAQEEILKQKLKSVTDAVERRKLSWLINYYQSRNNPASIDSAAINTYTGRFAEFEVFINNNKLYFRDNNNHNYIPMQLIPVSNLVFQVGRDYQVEFIPDKDTYRGIRMYWEDGWVEEIPRSQ